MFTADEVAYLNSQPLARLSTVNQGGQPDVVPVAFEYGVAGDPVERVGMVGPGTYVRITPTVSWSWNLDGRPAADEWYPMARTEHSITG